MILSSSKPEAKEHKRTERQGEVGNLERFYGVISSSQMDEAGKILLYLLEKKGPIEAKRFYMWLHEVTKECLKADKSYNQALFIMNRTPYVHENNPFQEPNLILREISALFKTGKYILSRRAADSFLSRNPEEMPLVNGRLYEPFMTLARRSLRKAREVAEVFKGYGYDCWIHYHLQQARINGGMNKPYKPEKDNKTC
jgi:hypothetical protein